MPVTPAPCPPFLRVWGQSGWEVPNGGCFPTWPSWGGRNIYSHTRVASRSRHGPMPEPSHALRKSGIALLKQGAVSMEMGN